MYSAFKLHMLMTCATTLRMENRQSRGTSDTVRRAKIEQRSIDAVDRPFIKEFVRFPW